MVFFGAMTRPGRSWPLILTLVVLTRKMVIASSESADEFEKKSPSQRFAKQFKDALFGMNPNAGDKDSNVAMSLVDALQNWADVLEAQISMMRSEVLELKQTNRKLSQEVSALAGEKRQLTTRVESLSKSFMSLKGEALMNEMQGDIRVMSSSFADFIDHFNDFSLSVNVNFTSFNQSLSLVSSQHESLTQLMSAEGDKMTEMSQKVEQNAENLISLTAEQQSLSANVQLLLYNASMAFYNDIDDLRGQSEVMQNDMMGVKKSIEFLNAKQNSLVNETDLVREQVLTSLEAIQTELVNSEQNTEKWVKPLLANMNSTLNSRLGKMEANVTDLMGDKEELKQDLFQISGMVTGNVNALKRHANNSVNLQEQVHDLATNVQNLQGNLENSTQALEAELSTFHQLAVYNSTLLQRGFFGLEKHFIEMKREIFEAKLQLVEVNNTLNNLGQLKSEVLSIGQALANSTSLVTDRFEDMTNTQLALQDSLTSLWNITDHLDMKLGHLEANHSLNSGIFQSDLKNVLSKHEDLSLNLVRSGNQSNRIESGLTELLNYTLSLDAKVMQLDSNMTSVNKTLKNQASDLRNVHDILEFQAEKILNFNSVLKENVTNLSIAANILETELSRVASGYNGLKNAVNRHVSNTGTIEVNVQRLLTESVFVKSELDSIRFDIAGVKSENSGMNVFVTSLQTQVTNLTNSMGMTSQNVSRIHDNLAGLETEVGNVNKFSRQIDTDLTQVKTTLNGESGKIADIGANVDSLKTNMVSLGSYINNINSDLGSMLSSFDGYAKKINGDLSTLRSNFSDFNDDFKTIQSRTEDMRKKMDSMAYSSTTLKADVTEITTKMYNLKTTNFEHSNEISGVKSTLKSLQNDLNALFEELAGYQTAETQQNVSLNKNAGDLNQIKTAMSTLSSR